MYARAKLGMGETDPIKKAFPTPYRWLEHRLYADEFYEATAFKLWNVLAILVTVLEAIINLLVEFATAVMSRIGSFFLNTVDKRIIDEASFDGTCSLIYKSSQVNKVIQNGFLQGYLRFLTGGAVLIGILLIIFAR